MRCRNLPRAPTSAPAAALRGDKGPSAEGAHDGEAKARHHSAREFRSGRRTMETISGLVRAGLSVVAVLQRVQLTGPYPGGESAGIRN